MKTPYFVYNTDVLTATLEEIHNQIVNSNFKIHYAIKANNNSKILKLINTFNIGADCVSGQEIQWALNSGFSPKNIVFAGVGKTEEEIIFAIKNKIEVIHCEGFQEAIVINEIATQLNENVKIALRLNPNVNAKTHEKITTGLNENKFGFSVIELNELIEFKHNLLNVDIIGLHFHIGSQINKMEVFKTLCYKVNDFVDFFNKEIGNLRYLNVGGGLGIDYVNPDKNLIPNFKAYFDVFKTNLNNIGVDIHFELGRSIVGQCGQLKTKVLYVKTSETKKFAVVDAGMTELLRPAMYEAYHQIDFNGISFIENREVYDVVGPICESSDCLGSNIYLPKLKRGDVLTVKSCGAYAESMHLSYNGRKKIESIFC